MYDQAAGALPKPSRRCDLCGAEMKHLGDLAQTIKSPAVRVFRCYACDHVAVDRF
jgi:transposase